MEFEPWWVGLSSSERRCRVRTGALGESVLRRGVPRQDLGFCPNNSSLPSFLP